MPLRAEVRHLYNTAAYRRERKEVLRTEGAWCKGCGRPHPRLNLAHLSHDPLDKLNRRLLCPSCHARNDASQRLAMTRRTKAARVGQAWILPELEWAPHPMRTWPVSARQSRLFEASA